MKSSTVNGGKRPLRVLYFIGSYGPDVMGNASHEETIVALRDRGHSIDVLTQITNPRAPRYTKAVYEGVSVYQVNLAARSSWVSSLTRRVATRFLRYDYMTTVISAYRRHLRHREYDLVHVEGAFPYGFVATAGSGNTPFMVTVQGADVIDLPDYDYGYRR